MLWSIDNINKKMYNLIFFFIKFQIFPEISADRDNWLKQD